MNTEQDHQPSNRNGKMLMENSMAKKNFDWLSLETSVRNEMAEMLKPFRQQLVTMDE